MEFSAEAFPLIVPSYEGGVDLEVNGAGVIVGDPLIFVAEVAFSSSPLRNNSLVLLSVGKEVAAGAALAVTAGDDIEAIGAGVTVGVRLMLPA